MSLFDREGRPNCSGLKTTAQTDSSKLQLVCNTSQLVARFRVTILRISRFAPHPSARSGAANLASLSSSDPTSSPPSPRTGPLSSQLARPHPLPPSRCGTRSRRLSKPQTIHALPRRLPHCLAYTHRRLHHVAVARGPHLRCASSAAPRVSGSSPHLLRAPCSRPIVRHRLGARRYTQRAHDEAHDPAPHLAPPRNGRGGCW